MRAPLFQRIPFVCVLASLFAICPFLAAQTPLIDCAGEAGDNPTRGFYIPYYPGTSLDRVNLYFSSRDPGQYTLSLTIRQSFFDGTQLGVSTVPASVTDFPTSTMVSFDFSPPINDVHGARLTFQIGVVTAPVSNPELYYDIPSGHDSGCPVVETKGTAPPLDTFKRQGVRIQVFGTDGAGPTLFENGAVNAASFRPPQVPGGAIAQGSIFSLFGDGLGSTTGVELEFPLGKTLLGISISVQGDGGSVAAIPLFSNGGQINAIMPSNAALGTVNITVTFNGKTTNAISAEVVTRSVGIFTARSSGFGPGIIQNFESAEFQPVNSLHHAGRPGQIVSLWGTGLGAITAPDNQAPPVGNVTDQIEITVGGVPVTQVHYSGRSPCCAGLDQIVFDVPSTAPLGCYVPVMIRTNDNNVVSNTVTMAIKTDQSLGCEDPLNPAVSGIFANTAEAKELGTIVLSHSVITASVAPGQVVDLVMERGVADFGRSNPFFFDSAISLPPLGTCRTQALKGSFPTGMTDVLDLLNSQPLIGLDAGPAITVVRESDGALKELDPVAPGAYYAILGGGPPLPGFPPPEPSFVLPGRFAVSGPGGAQGPNRVGSFETSITIPAGLTWENRDQILEVDRSQPLTLRWSGGDPSTQVVWVAVNSIIDAENVASGVLCSAAVGAGQFTIPADVLATVPASVSDPLGLPGGFVGVGTLPTEQGTTTFQASGLTRGTVQYFQLSIVPVAVK